MVDKENGSINKFGLKVHVLFLSVKDIIKLVNIYFLIKEQ